MKSVMPHYSQIKQPVWHRFQVLLENVKNNEQQLFP